MERLHVRVCEAHEIKTSDAFVEIRIKNSTHYERTKVAKKSKSPVWNEEFVLTPTNINDMLQIKVYDYSSVFNNELVGELEIPIAAYIGKGHIEEQRPLMHKLSPTTFKPGQGFIRLQVEYGRRLVNPQVVLAPANTMPAMPPSPYVASAPPVAPSAPMMYNPEVPQQAPQAPQYPPPYAPLYPTPQPPAQPQPVMQAPPVIPPPQMRQSPPKQQFVAPSPYPAPQYQPPYPPTPQYPPPVMPVMAQSPPVYTIPPASPMILPNTYVMTEPVVIYETHHGHHGHHGHHSFFNKHHHHHHHC